MDQVANGDGLVVRYVLDVEGDYRIDEAESMLQFEEYAPSIRAAGYCEGAIVVAAPAQDPLSLDDALPYLVKHLCFLSLARLRANQTVTIPLFLSGLDVVASVQDGSIRLELSGGGSAHYEKLAMMRALYECGARFAAFHARLWAGEPGHELDVANLEHNRLTAMAAVGPDR